LKVENGKLKIKEDFLARGEKIKRIKIKADIVGA